MKVLVSATPGNNSYLSSLINAYISEGCEVICGKHNFFFSNFCPDLVHIHWPEILVDWVPFNSRTEEDKLNIIKERLNFYSVNKAVIVLTIHNIKPHDKKSIFLEKVYNLIIDASNIFVHHCSESIELLKREYEISDNKKHIIAKHGDYLEDYIHISKNIAREKLKINKNKFVILNFGQQREYKRVDFLNKIFSKTKIKNKYLLTAGNFQYSTHSLFKRYWTKIINYIKTKNNFSSKKFIYKNSNKDMIALIFNSADVLLISHKSGLTSGVLNLAATYSLPVVFPKVGCFESQMKDWVYEAYELSNLDDAVSSIEKIHKNYFDINFDNNKWLSNNTWKAHVMSILNSIHFSANN